ELPAHWPVRVPLEAARGQPACTDARRLPWPYLERVARAEHELPAGVRVHVEPIVSVDVQIVVLIRQVQRFETDLEMVGDVDARLHVHVGRGIRTVPAVEVVAGHGGQVVVTIGDRCAYAE